MQGRTVQVSTERQLIIHKDVFSCRRKMWMLIFGCERCSSQEAFTTLFEWNLRVNFVERT